MSVVSIGAHPDSISADDEKGTYGWIITTDNKLDEPIGFVGALQASGDLPYRGDPHPENSFLRATGLKVVRWNGSKFHWLATCDFKLVLSDQEEDQEERQDVPDPLDRDPKITKTFDRAEVAIWKDVNGDAILNTAGDPFLEPVVVPRSSPVWNIAVNLAASPSWMDELADKINSGSNTIRGRTYTAGQLLFEPGSESFERSENGVEYVRVEFKLLVNLKGWKERRYSNGLNEISSDGQKRKIKLPFEDEDGNPLDYEDAAREFVSDPQLLDENGAMIENPDPGTAHEQEFDVFEEADFSSLPGVS